MKTSKENKETEICSKCGKERLFHFSGFCPCKKFTPKKKGSHSPQEKDPLGEIFMNERETRFFWKGVEKGKNDIIQGVINAMIEYRDELRKKEKE